VASPVDSDRHWKRVTVSAESVDVSVDVCDWMGDWTWSHSARSESVLRPLKGDRLLRRDASWLELWKKVLSPPVSPGELLVRSLR